MDDDIERIMAMEAAATAAATAGQEMQQGAAQLQLQAQQHAHSVAAAARQAEEAQKRLHAYDANADQSAALSGKGRFQADSDDRSVYVSNLPPGVGPQEIGTFFMDCGTIAKISVLMNRATNQPKNAAYIEYSQHEGAGRAIDTKHNTLFNGSQISVHTPSGFLVFAFRSCGRKDRGLRRGRACALMRH
jgi:alanyl-tRNA synthetase